MAGRVFHPRFSAMELAKMEKMQKAQESPGEVFEKLQRIRAQKGVTGPSESAVYRFMSGETYNRDMEETRGRPPTFGARHLRVLDQVRKKLIKDADNEYTVTWEDICTAGKVQLRKKNLLGARKPMWSEDWVAKQMRDNLDVRRRRSRARVARTTGEEALRLEKGQEWQKLPASWWTKDIHGYIDTKTFVLAPKPKDKKLMRQTRVHYHLRTPSEGASKGFVVPKARRMLFGLKTIDVTAAVAQDRIIMWHVSKGKWCGRAAASMYAKLGQALRKTWGSKRSFRVIEDGDRKGFQSGKGKDAKLAEHLESWTLPPRSPEWMPLDFCLWTEIEGRVLAKKVVGPESARTYEARLRRTALKLPRALVRDCLEAVPKRIRMTVEAKGAHIKVD